MSYRETLRRLDDHEHFGFRDGISQPGVIGYDTIGEIQPGSVVFGYPQAPGGPPFLPVNDPRGVTDNGSLLVFRRLQQNVGAFRKFCSDQAAVLAQAWPGISPSIVGAYLVGRWPSGVPVAGQAADPGTQTPDNTFDFLADQAGSVCPLGAHIRKVNPRKGPKDVLQIPRILRRGVPFGRPFDEAPGDPERGLAFLAYQSSIREKFEFLTQQWMNSDLNPGRGSDLLVGRGVGVRTMAVSGPHGDVTFTAPVDPWITPTGGAYLFAPARSALRKFADPAPKLGLWKVRQLLSAALDAVMLR
ncbi:Dyp-type peroxidase [Chenggangzhangella methanolivorans]|uniref:Dyp-type peroxidase n=1 Tax=Chenggangzhangella methanolivorans TaxID=1437009 RepID=A0A9E6R6E0_9HYPH|nr:Dyp-type peroxidase domain-containing protein [Chenggangzhangella methanolivorans]QZN99095.1 Dyp-type peroxidase [Chenggangzhangella methanolivorans]